MKFEFLTVLKFHSQHEISLAGQVGASSPPTPQVDQTPLLLPRLPRTTTRRRSCGGAALGESKQGREREAAGGVDRDGEAAHSP